LTALEDDHEFLPQGGVFTEDVIQKWIDCEREKEVKLLELRPLQWAGGDTERTMHRDDIGFALC
jgi:glutamine synthetase